MKRILNIAKSDITTYTHHTYLLSILGNDERTRDWIYSNYIQVYINKDLTENSWGEFYFPMAYEVKIFEHCKWINVQVNSEQYVDRHYEDIVLYIKDMLSNGYYVHLMIDYKYLSNSVFGKNNSEMVHDILIYGYDDEIQTLYCAGFMFKSSKFTLDTCTYEEINNAYNSKAVKEEFSYMGHNIYSYALAKECDYEFHIKNIIYGLKLYCNCEIPEYWKGYNYCNKKKISWGLEYYDVLKDSICYQAPEYIDIKLIYLLEDHKRMMISRLEFLGQLGYDLEKYKQSYVEMEQINGLLVKMAIKYNISKKTNILNQLKEKISDLKQQEYEVLVNLIAYLEEKSGER